MTYEQLCLFISKQWFKNRSGWTLCAFTRKLSVQETSFLISDKSNIAVSNICTDDSWASRMNTPSRLHGNGMFVNNPEGFQKSKFNQHRGNPTVVSTFRPWLIRYLRMSVIVSVRGRTAEGAPTASLQTAALVLTPTHVCPSDGSYWNLLDISGVLRQKLAAAHLSSSWTWK